MVAFIINAAVARSIKSWSKARPLNMRSEVEFDCYVNNASTTEYLLRSIVTIRQQDEHLLMILSVHEARGRIVSRRGE